MAQVDLELAGVCRKRLVVTALALVALFLASFSVLGTKFWPFVHSWVFVKGWGTCVFLESVSPNLIRQA